VPEDLIPLSPVIFQDTSTIDEEVLGAAEGPVAPEPAGETLVDNTSSTDSNGTNMLPPKEATEVILSFLMCAIT
jgi:hypothetical protein